MEAQDMDDHDRTVVIGRRVGYVSPVGLLEPFRGVGISMGCVPITMVDSIPASLW